MRPDPFKELKQIATAGAATATGSKIVPKKRVIAHVSYSQPVEGFGVVWGSWIYLASFYALYNLMSNFNC